MVLYLHNTSRVQGVKYDGLLREKGFGGFPTLAFMDAEGAVLTSSVERSVAGFKRSAEALAALSKLEAADKQKPLQGDEAVKLLFAQLDLGKVKFGDAKARLDSLQGVSEANLKAIAQRAVDFDIGEVFTKHRASLQNVPAAERAAAAAKMQEAIAKDLQAMADAGKVPSDKGAFQFWQTLYSAAQRAGDAAGLERAKKQLEALAERDPSSKRRVEMLFNPPKRGEGGVAPVRIVPGGGDAPKATTGGVTSFEAEVALASVLAR